VNANKRQTCKVCGRPDKFNFHVPDDVWTRAIPHQLASGVVCLFCFDALAEARGVDYASSLGEFWFAGDKAVVEFSVCRRIEL
jgi:hypothetical protein